MCTECVCVCMCVCVQPFPKSSSFAHSCHNALLLSLFFFFFAKVAELAENSFIIIVVVDLSPVLADELSAFNGVSEVLIDRAKLFYCFLSLLMMAAVISSEAEFLLISGLVHLIRL